VSQLTRTDQRVWNSATQVNCGVTAQVTVDLVLVTRDLERPQVKRQGWANETEVTNCVPDLHTLTTVGHWANLISTTGDTEATVPTAS
jgi:hypothetical protein